MPVRTTVSAVITARRMCAAAFLACAATSCSTSLETTLQRLMQAQQLSASLLAEFGSAVDAANRAVMSNDDESSRTFAREAGEATQAVQKTAETLAPTLMNLGYSAESRLLEEFNTAFAEYRALDDTILGLAVENTNLKAQRLSFGPAREAADAFVNALGSPSPSAAADSWRVRALVATAAVGVREIQVLQAPHIAEADDAVMTTLEKQMQASEAGVRSAVEMLGNSVSRESQSRIAAATAALDRFMAVHAEILALSRRNSNVRSLALTLGQKRTLAAKCEETLRALQDALAKRTVGGTR
jgi:hypothetical protein